MSVESGDGRPLRTPSLPRVHGAVASERRAIAHADDLLSIPEGLASTVNELFAVSLDLAAVRALVDGEAGGRIETAIEEIDAIISAVRTRSYAMALDHRTESPECGGPCRW